MNRVTHFEIYTDDPEAVRPFYQDVFGWKFHKSKAGRWNIGWSLPVMTKTRESMAGSPVREKVKIPAL